MNTNANFIGKGFDRMSRIYDAVVCIVSLNRINKSQLGFLSHLSTQNTALILGGGTGYFLQKVLEQNQEIHITYVDVSAKMIEFAKKRIEMNRAEDLIRVSFICKSAEDFEWTTYDFIICNYFLDLFDDTFVKVLAEKFKKHLNPQGLLYVTDFHIPKANGFLKWCTKMGLKVLYAFFRWAANLCTNQLPEMERILKEQGFFVSDSKYYLRGILMCRLYKMDN